MLPQLVLLPPLGHKEAIATLGYPIALKLVRVGTFDCWQTDKQTHTGLYNIDAANEIFLIKLKISIST